MPPAETLPTTPERDHPLRGPGVGELHARPFPVLSVPCRAVFLALMPNAEGGPISRDAAHRQLLDLIGPAEPGPSAEATHWSGTSGGVRYKWESHTEFNSYWAFLEGAGPEAFDAGDLKVFPGDWQDRAKGARIAALHITVQEMPESRAALLGLCRDWFSAESLALAEIVGGAAVIAGDFRMDERGYMRFAVFAKPGTGPRRIGRIVQRLCEVEVYRAMSMLGLFEARRLGARLDRLDPRLLSVVARLDTAGSGAGPQAEEALQALLAISAELEQLSVESSFRFGASAAYAAIVEQRISVLREERVEGHQTFTEFMMRRYDPAIRTTRAAEARLARMAERAARAAELLRTMVDVERSAQNQRLLTSMDRRSDLALRLQHTVEGLSVVAISYYAHGLAKSLLAPFAEKVGLTSGTFAAALVPPVMLVVWLALRRLRRGFH